PDDVLHRPAIQVLLGVLSAARAQGHLREEHPPEDEYCGLPAPLRGPVRQGDPVPAVLVCLGALLAAHAASSRPENGRAKAGLISRQIARSTGLSSRWAKSIPRMVGSQSWTRRANSLRYSGVPTSRYCGIELITLQKTCQVVLATRLYS